MAAFWRVPAAIPLACGEAPHVRLVQAFSGQKSPESVRLGQKKAPGLRDAFICVPWLGQMGAVFFVGSDVAGSTWATGGAAPMAFRRSMIRRKSPARPSPSIVTKKPSSAAWILNLQDGCGALSVMGVTLSCPFIGCLLTGSIRVIDRM